MKSLKKHTLMTASARAGMDVKTGRKYRDTGMMPSQMQTKHDWKTRKDPFEAVWQDIKEMLEQAPGLQSKSIFAHLQCKYPGKFKDGQLRTLQRKLQTWRAINGAGKQVMFTQRHRPGEQSQSDYTVMNKLNITINGEPFEHLLFHFILVYSRWEYVDICCSESFESLTSGYEKAVWNLGYTVKEHRTDNLTAATQKFGSRRAFTKQWQKVMKHYGVTPSKNNPGESHENGSIEKSHDLFKTAVDQQLMLRGSRDFKTTDEYRKFLFELLNQRNKTRSKELLEEIPFLKELPEDKWYSPKVISVKVGQSSVVQILGISYSVPSRLIGYTLKAHIYPDKIELYYGNTKLQDMPRVFEGFNVDYRHIIDSLIRKPGAFENYQYREALFPTVCFRKAYDCLCRIKPNSSTKLYLGLLHLAKQHGEQLVNMAIQLILDEKQIPTSDNVKPLLDSPIRKHAVHVNAPNLSSYDKLRQETCNG